MQQRVVRDGSINLVGFFKVLTMAVRRVPSTGRNPVILLNNTHEPHTQRLLSQLGAATGQAVHAGPILYMLPPIILPAGP
jgi:hypothetical protein